MFISCDLGSLILVLTLCGQAHSGGIIGGHEAKRHSRPYMALLEMGNGNFGHCGGFLLNQEFVMTAAHCKAKSYKVFLGLHSYYDKKGIQQLSVEKTFPHGDYRAKPLRNDIMLLKLSSKAELNDHVQPLALAEQDDGSLPESCIVSGWGRQNNSHHMSIRLWEVNVTLTNNSLCAGEPVYCSEGLPGPASGDSGGPLVCGDKKAYGVVSGGNKPQMSTIHRYTKISDYKDWIDNIINPK